MKRPVNDIRHHTDILKVVRLMDRMNSSWWGKEWGGWGGYFISGLFFQVKWVGKFLVFHFSLFDVGGGFRFQPQSSRYALRPVQNHVFVFMRTGSMHSHDHG